MTDAQAPHTPTPPTEDTAPSRIGRLNAVALALIGLTWIHGRLFPQGWDSENGPFVFLTWSAFMCQVFVFHFGLAALPFALIAGAKRWRRQMALATGVLLVSFGPTVWSWFDGRTRPDTQTPLRLTTANLLMLNRNAQRLTETFRQADADVLCFQEYTPWAHRRLTAALAESHPFRITRSRSDSFGIAIYSKIPLRIDDPPFLSLGGVDLPQARVELQLPGGRRAVLYNVHLLPPRGLDFFTRQRRQVRDLCRRLSAETLPVIVAGDFNFTPGTHPDRSLRRLGWTDALDTAARGRQPTWWASHLGWPGLGFVPGLRLDHVYLARGASARQAAVGPDLGSDHRPVTVTIGFAPIAD